MRRNKKDTLGVVIDILSETENALHYKKIAELAVKNGWTPLAGAPESAINAVINGDIRYRKSKSYFIKESRGYFKLRYSSKVSKAAPIIENKIESLETLCFNILTELETFKHV